MSEFRIAAPMEGLPADYRKAAAEHFGSTGPARCHRCRKRRKLSRVVRGRTTRYWRWLCRECAGSKENE